MTIHPVEDEVFHADGKTDMKKLTVAFRNFRKAPNKIRTRHENPRGLCHGSGSQWPASHRGGPASTTGQSVWDLRCTKWHWDRFFSEYFGFPCQCYSTNVPRSFLHSLINHRRCTDAVSSHQVTASLINTLTKSSDG